jgi:hypothetical protein
MKQTGRKAACCCTVRFHWQLPGGLGFLGLFLSNHKTKNEDLVCVPAPLRPRGTSVQTLRSAMRQETRKTKSDIKHHTVRDISVIPK